jgi:predicted nuclease of predicted toxin-antitoxin system
MGTTPFMRPRLAKIRTMRRSCWPRIVTQDKDFGALALQAGAVSTGIVRIKRVPNRLFVSRIVDALARHEDDLLAGAIVTVEPGRLRVLRHPKP